MFAPAPKSAIAATLWSATNGIGKFTGPSEPGPAPIAARISSSFAMRSGLATCASFSALTAFNSWSPRTSSATSECSPPGAAATTSVLMVFSTGIENPSTSARMVLTPGVSARRISSDGFGRGVSGGGASAISKLVAYFPPAESAIASSPDSAST